MGYHYCRKIRTYDVQPHGASSQNVRHNSSQNSNPATFSHMCQNNTIQVNTIPKVTQPEKGGKKVRGAKEEALRGGGRKGKIERGEQALLFET